MKTSPFLILLLTNLLAENVTQTQKFFQASKMASNVSVINNSHDSCWYYLRQNKRIARPWIIYYKIVLILYKFPTLTFDWQIIIHLIRVYLTYIWHNPKDHPYTHPYPVCNYMTTLYQKQYIGERKRKRENCVNYTKQFNSAQCRNVRPLSMCQPLDVWGVTEPFYGNRYKYRTLTFVFLLSFFVLFCMENTHRYKITDAEASSHFAALNWI